MGRITFDDTLSQLVSGAHLVSKTVEPTYGPQGRTVMLQRLQGLLSTKDGVTIARELDHPNRVVNLGVQLAKSASLKVNDEVGDGTTTTLILLDALVREGLKLGGGRALCEGLRRGVRLLEPALGDIVAPLEDREALRQVILASCGWDEEVAEQVTEASLAVGRDGTIVVEEGVREGIHLVMKDGMEIPTCLPFSTRSPGRPLEGPLVAVLDKTLHSYRDISSVLETASQYPPYAVLVVAQRVTGEALTTIKLNEKQDKFQFQCLEAPGPWPWKTDVLKDIAALSGAVLVDPKAGHDHRQFDPSWYGSLRKVEVGHERTLLVGYPEHLSQVDRRVQELKAELGRCASDYDKDQYLKRIAKLVGGLCVLEVGGPTEAALKERRGRLEDALAVARGALESGVLPGGGTAYLEASEYLRALPPDEGLWVLSKALEQPLKVLAGPAVLEQVRQCRRSDDTGWVGWDEVSGTIRDLGISPIIADPYSVVRTVIRTAVSVATTILSSAVAVTR